MNLMRGMLVGIYTKLDAIFTKEKRPMNTSYKKLQHFSGKYNSNYDGEVVIANDYFVFNNVIYQQGN